MTKYTTHALSDEEARRAAACHRVYDFLLQIAARKEAARDMDGTPNEATAGEAPVAEPNAEEGA